jgi:hypothetical protein
MAVDLAKVITAGGQVAYLLAGKLCTRIVRGLNEGIRWRHDHQTVAADVDPLALKRQVCFGLAITNRAVLAVYRPLLEPLGLTHPQYLVMLALWDNEKSSSPPLSVKQIAALLQMDSATLSPMLKRLQALGLITRLRSATDERHAGGADHQGPHLAPPSWPTFNKLGVKRVSDSF